MVRSTRMNNVMKPAIFLDRDGVLTKEKGYVCSLDNLEIFPYVEQCIKKIKEKGYYTIVVTNQSGVARGFFTENDLKEMNRYLQEKTGVDAVYYCPHHPEGRVMQYRKACGCRKPEAGMIDIACKEFSINIANSYMVGDRASDIQMGKKIGVRTILLESGYGTERLEETVDPDYILKDLREVLYVLK